jgi:hypothetical protein
MIAKARGNDPKAPRAVADASGTTVILTSILTCPLCGTSVSETMPTNACVVYYKCTGCHTLLRPKPGDCCVFCSHGSLPCPPMQQSTGCC